MWMKWKKADRKHVDLNTLSREQLLEVLTSVRDRIFPSARKMIAKDAPCEEQAESCEKDWEKDWEKDDYSRNEDEWETIANIFFRAKLAPMDVERSEDEDDWTDDEDDCSDDEEDVVRFATE